MSQSHILICSWDIFYLGVKSCRQDPFLYLIMFMFFMESFILLNKHQQETDCKESTGNPDHLDSEMNG